MFPLWITGYYSHGDTLETLSLREASDEPSPTVVRMSPEDLASTFHEPPTLLDGTDTVILQSGVDRGVLSRLRKAAMFAPQNTEVAWPNVEFRYFFCDRSVWLMHWGVWSFRAEVEQARKDGKRIRTHSIVRMRGANHCRNLYSSESPDHPSSVFLYGHYMSSEGIKGIRMSIYQEDDLAVMKVNFDMSCGLGRIWLRQNPVSRSHLRGIIVRARSGQCELEM
ncbi:hypothetical protein BJY52DRAFT_1227834 [Lactarius psammicola]|nr:hypothetical protein BJY52DRAFT_1227834 [Lactarius psammicola]